MKHALLSNETTMSWMFQPIACSPKLLDQLKPCAPRGRSTKHDLTLSKKMFHYIASNRQTCRCNHRLVKLQRWCQCWPLHCTYQCQTIFNIRSGAEANRQTTQFMCLQHLHFKCLEPWRLYIIPECSLLAYLSF